MKSIKLLSKFTGPSKLLLSHPYGVELRFWDRTRTLQGFWVNGTWSWLRGKDQTIVLSLVRMVDGVL